MGKIKVFLIDDHQIVIDGLLAVLKLEKDMQVVGQSLHANEVYKKIVVIIPTFMLLPES